MKIKIILLSAIIIAVLLSSCGEEKIIDNSSNKWKLIVSTEQQPSALALYEMPSAALLSADIFEAVNGEKLPSPASKICEFRDLLYILMPSEYLIEIIDKYTYKRQARIDFSQAGLEPTDICFPNATDAYICHGNDSTVSLLDLTTFTIARTITAGLNPMAIAASGNQILVANRGDNTVSIIDSRLHLETDKIPVGDVPSFVDIHPNGLEAVIVSVGYGKVDSADTKTAATVTFIDIAKKSVIKTIPLNIAEVQAINTLPKGLTATSISWGFVTVGNAVVRLDLRSHIVSRIASRKPADMLIYKQHKEQLYYIRGGAGSTEIEIADQTTGITSGSVFNVPQPATFVYPL